MPSGRCGSTQARSLAPSGGHSAQGPGRAWQGQGHRGPGAWGAPGPAGPGGDLSPHSQDPGPARAVCLSGFPKPPNVDRQWAVLGVMTTVQIWGCPREWAEYVGPRGTRGPCPPASSWTGQRSHRARLGPDCQEPTFGGSWDPGLSPPVHKGVSGWGWVTGCSRFWGPCPSSHILGLSEGPRAEMESEVSTPQGAAGQRVGHHGRRYGYGLSFHHSCEAGSGVQGRQRNWGFPKHKSTDAQTQLDTEEHMGLQTLDPRVPPVLTPHMSSLVSPHILATTLSAEVPLFSRPPRPPY